MILGQSTIFHLTKSIENRFNYFAMCIGESLRLLSEDPAVRKRNLKYEVLKAPVRIRDLSWQEPIIEEKAEAEAEGEADPRAEAGPATDPEVVPETDVKAEADGPTGEQRIKESQVASPI